MSNFHYTLECEDGCVIAGVGMTGDHNEWYFATRVRHTDDAMAFCTALRVASTILEDKLERYFELGEEGGIGQGEGEDTPEE